MPSSPDMTRFYKILLLIITILLLSWLLPWGLRLMMPERQTVPFTLYSEVVHQFASLEPVGQKNIRYYDHSGRTYTETQFDSILPSFYHRQLIMDDRMPDSINGLPVDAETMRRAGFIFRSIPSEINKHAVPLYPLLESLPKRVDLEMPDDVFRLTDTGIEFIDMESNVVLSQKSDLFTTVMKEKGVTFPIRYVAGNPTNRKEYDEGYFIIDKKEHLYHLKQSGNRPFVRRVFIPEELHIAQIFVTEYPSRSTFAFITDTDDRFYVLTRPDYRLRQVDLPPTDLSEQEMMIIGNAYYWTVTRNTQAGEVYTAIDATTLESVDSLTFARSGTRVSAVSKYLFPFHTVFTSMNHSYFKPEMHDFSLHALPLGAVLAVIFVLTYRQRIPRSRLVLQGIVVLLTGLYGFVPLILLREP